MFDGKMMVYAFVGISLKQVVWRKDLTYSKLVKRLKWL